MTASPDGSGWEAALKALAEAQARTEERFAELSAAQVRTEERLAELSAAEARTEERLAELSAAQARTEASLESLASHMAKLADAGDVRSWVWEARYRDRAHAYVSGILRRIQVLAAEQLTPLLDGAVSAGRLTEDEANEIERADLICRGRSRADGLPAYLVVEISAGVGPSDVERAARRAGLLGKADTRALAAVAGQGLTPKARELAQQLGVWRITNGTAVAP